MRCESEVWKTINDMAATTGLSRRKGSSLSSRSGASQYVFYITFCLAAIMLALVAGMTMTLFNAEHRPKTTTITKDDEPRMSAAKAAQDAAASSNSLSGSVRMAKLADTLDQATGRGGVRRVVDNKSVKEVHLNNEPVVAKVTTTKGAIISGGPTKATKDTLVIETYAGDIRIVLQQELSLPSVEYIHNVVNSGGSSSKCNRCLFYRAEQKGILQGMIKSDTVPIVTERGACPPGFETIENKCPEHDTKCGCHGPLMERGMVGWAAGKTGPDFFIDDYRKPARHWGTQHTVWGRITDQESFAVLDRIWALPTAKKGGLTYLNDPIKFTMRIEEAVNK